MKTTGRAFVVLKTNSDCPAHCCLTLLLPHCLIVRLHDCLIVLLSDCLTVLVPDCLTVRLMVRQVHGS